MLSIIAWAPFRTPICTSCTCMGDFPVPINAPGSCACNALFQSVFGGRGEKIWRIQCRPLVRVPWSRPPFRLITSKRTTPLNERKLSIESYEQIQCIEYNIVCMPAHSKPQNRLESLDTARILVRSKHCLASCPLSPPNHANTTMI
jgi:hypothetical protein